MKAAWQEVRDSGLVVAVALALAVATSVVFCFNAVWVALVGGA